MEGGGGRVEGGRRMPDEPKERVRRSELAGGGLGPSSERVPGARHVHSQLHLSGWSTSHAFVRLEHIIPFVRLEHIT